MQIPCVYIPGPAPAVSVANNNCARSLHNLNVATKTSSSVIHTADVFIILISIVHLTSS